MKAPLLYLFILGFVWFVAASDFTIDWASVVTTEPDGFSANIDIGTCVCDLTHNVCDVYCCCDPDCSAEEVALFDGNCLPEGPPAAETVCLTTSMGDKLCVEKDNNPSDGSYYAVPAELVAGDLSTKIDSLAHFPFLYDEGIAGSTPTSYTAGDYLVGVFPALTPSPLGLISVPGAAVTGQCSSAHRFARFLEDIPESACVRYLDDLSAKCASDFDARPYQLDTVKVATTPVPSTSVAFALGTLQKIDLATGALTTVAGAVPAPSFAGTTCSDALYSVTYRFKYGATGAVSEANVDIVLVDIAAAAATDPYAQEQKFAVQFYSQATQLPFNHKSGNPGYVFGKPLLAGLLTTNAGKSAITQSSSVGAGLGIAAASATGRCTGSATHDVSFGEDTLSACSLGFIINDVKTTCTTIRQTAIDYLYGSASTASTHVGAVGNADYENIYDWVEMSGDRPSASVASTAALGSGECNEVVVGLKYEVLYAGAGSIKNPQYVVVGVRRAPVLGTVRFPCHGSELCLASSLATNYEVTLQLETSVRFVRSPQSSEDGSVVADHMPEAPSFFDLPTDFFYPLRSSANAAKVGMYGSLLALVAGLLLLAT